MLKSFYAIISQKQKRPPIFEKKIIQTARQTVVCDLFHHYGNYGNTVFARSDKFQQSY